MSVSMRRSSLVLWAMLGLAIFLVVWSFMFEIDQTVRAQGQIMTSTRTQVIQAADGGVLEKLMVSEGQTVSVGQVLAVLEKERANAGVDEGSAKLAGLKAIFARAKAESNGVDPLFPDELKKYPELIGEQLAVFNQRKKTLVSELSALQESLQMAEQELKMHEKLHATGDISQLELMRARRMVLEGQSKIDSVRNKYRQDAVSEAAKIQEDLISQKHKLEERMSVLEHTTLKSPVDGVVKAMRVNTVGGVLRAGDELMQISPTGTDLMVEVKINPTDIGQLKLGLPVAVKVDAFDYSIYGTLTGSLDYISSDTLTEQNPAGQTSLLYRAQIGLSPNHGNEKFSVASLKPGMTASVDIKTGRRSVFDFMFKPVVKAFDGAGSQR